MKIQRFRFRAWDKKNEKFMKAGPHAHDFTMFGDTGTIAGVPLDWQGSEDPDDFEITQATIYVDKKKKPIFEGDICTDRFKRKLTVVFFNGRLQWRSDDPDDNFKYADLWQWLDKSKGMSNNETILTVDIIGNIYQPLKSKTLKAQ